MIIVGFTGSWRPLKFSQGEKIRAYLMTHQVKEIHHDDYLGADAAVHEIAEALAIPVVIHPPTDDRLRAHCPGRQLPAQPYLVRNKDIVDSCDVLLAAQATAAPRQRSGTWATVRYARKNNKETIIIPGDEK